MQLTRIWISAVCASVSLMRSTDVRLKHQIILISCLKPAKQHSNPEDSSPWLSMTSISCVLSSTNLTETNYLLLFLSDIPCVGELFEMLCTWAESTFPSMWSCNPPCPADPRIIGAVEGSCCHQKSFILGKLNTDRPLHPGRRAAGMTRITIPAWKLSMWLTSSPTLHITIASLITSSSVME